MTIVLDTDLEQLISEKLAAGKYPSANEMLRESLRLLQEQEATEQQQREVWQREIATGLQQLKEGRSVILNEDTLADIKARGRARLAQQSRQESA